MAMKPYVIRQGDYLTKLAHTLGFDADKVWNDGKNADLKKSRQDPNMLQAGDILFIPDEPRQRFPLNAKIENDFVATVPTVGVSVVMKEDDVPVANEKYTLEGLGDDEKQYT